MEVSQLLNFFKGHPILHGLLSVLTTTGCRIQELCTARVCDLNYYEGIIWLTVIFKGSKKRELLIHPPVLEAIKKFRKRIRQYSVLDSSDTSPLFTIAKNKSYSYKVHLSNYILRKVNRVELDFSILRNTPITAHTFILKQR